MTLTLLPEPVTICRLPPETAPPAWAWHGDFCSVTRTPAELSVVCAAASIPEGIQCERDWRVLAVAGVLTFDMTGVMASLAEPLAGAGVSIFTISTFDTDYLLVAQASLGSAVAALQMAGNTIQDAPASAQEFHQ